MGRPPALSAVPRLERGTAPPPARRRGEASAGGRRRGRAAGLYRPEKKTEGGSRSLSLLSGDVPGDVAQPLFLAVAVVDHRHLGELVQAEQGVHPHGRQLEHEGRQEA